MDKKTKEKRSTDSLFHLLIPEQKAPPLAAVTCQELYSILKNKEKVLLMDTRAKDQFDLSRINHTHCINVPGNIAPPG